MFRVDDRGVDIGEDLKLIRDADIVAIRGYAEGNDALAHLVIDERLDHAMLLCHFADPMIWFNSHSSSNYLALRDC